METLKFLKIEISKSIHSQKVRHIIASIVNFNHLIV